MPKLIVERVAHKRNYKTLCFDFAEDKALSWAAKGMLACILSRPDDWGISETDLLKNKSKERDPKTVRKHIGELCDAGYIVRLVKRHEDGFMDWFWVVFEQALPKKAKEERIKEIMRDRGLVLAPKVGRRKEADNRKAVNGQDKPISVKPYIGNADNISLNTLPNNLTGPAQDLPHDVSTTQASAAQPPSQLETSEACAGEARSAAPSVSSSEGAGKGNGSMDISKEGSDARKRAQYDLGTPLINPRDRVWGKENS